MQCCTVQGSSEAFLWGPSANPCAHKVDQSRQTNSVEHRVNVAITKCKSSIDFLWIAHNETSKVPEWASLRVALRHIWEIHLIVVSLRAFGVRNVVLKVESIFAKMFFVFCTVFPRHIHKFIGVTHVLPNDLTQGDLLAPVWHTNRRRTKRIHCGQKQSKARRTMKTKGHLDGTEIKI